MTESPPRTRRRFPEIAPAAWEHPADRAALRALRATPGFEELVRKLLGFLRGEQGVRLLFQGNAIRIGPKQLPKLWELQVEVASTLDAKEVPELYIAQTPIFNAGTYGLERPFVVLHSSALEILNVDEQRALLAHEVGHARSGHAYYRTIATIVLGAGLSAFPGLAGLALLPLRMAFLEWSRRAELSSDRAALLGTQDPKAVLGLLMKVAGGGRPGSFSDDLDVDAFLEQSREYAGADEGLEPLYKFLQTMAFSHPLATVRAAELDRFAQSAEYERILAGEYRKKGTAKQGEDEPERPWTEDLKDAGAFYAKAAREAAESIRDAAAKAAEQIAQSLRRPTARP